MRGWVKSIFRRIFYGFPLIFRCFSQGMDGKGEGEKVREEWMGKGWLRRRTKSQDCFNF